MIILPPSRQSDVVVQELENEILIYDLKINKAFCLNETTAKVYNACDGQTSIDQLKLKHSLTDEIVFLALDQLNNQNLLENNDYQSPFAGMSRREVIRQVGLASMIALPLISSVVAPSSVDAQSGLNLPLLAVCSIPAQCASGNCKNGMNCCAPGNVNLNFPGQVISVTGLTGDCMNLNQTDFNNQCNSSLSINNCCSGIGFVGTCM